MSAQPPAQRAQDRAVRFRLRSPKPCSKKREMDSSQGNIHTLLSFVRHMLRVGLHQEPSQS